jgi:hypothetical protein
LVEIRKYRKAIADYKKKDLKVGYAYAELTKPEECEAAVRLGFT